MRCESAVARRFASFVKRLAHTNAISRTEKPVRSVSAGAFVVCETLPGEVEALRGASNRRRPRARRVTNFLTVGN